MRLNSLFRPLADALNTVASFTAAHPGGRFLCPLVDFSLAKALIYTEPLSLEQNFAICYRPLGLAQGSIFRGLAQIIYRQGWLRWDN